MVAVKLIISTKYLDNVAIVGVASAVFDGHAGPLVPPQQVRLALDGLFHATFDAFLVGKQDEFNFGSASLSRYIHHYAFRE